MGSNPTSSSSRITGCQAFCKRDGASSNLASGSISSSTIGSLHPAVNREVVGSTPTWRAKGRGETANTTGLNPVAARYVGSTPTGPTKFGSVGRDSLTGGRPRTNPGLRSCWSSSGSLLVIRVGVSLPVSSTRLTSQRCGWNWKTRPSQKRLPLMGVRVRVPPALP